MLVLKISMKLVASFPVSTSSFFSHLLHVKKKLGVETGNEATKLVNGTSAKHPHTPSDMFLYFKVGEEPYFSAASSTN